MIWALELLASVLIILVVQNFYAVFPLVSGILIVALVIFWFAVPLCTKMTSKWIDVRQKEPEHWI